MDGLLSFLSSLFALYNPTNVLTDTSLIFFSRSFNNAKILTINSNFSEVYSTKFFDPQKTSIVFVYDWNCGYTSESSKTIVKALLKNIDNKKYNVLIANWGDFAKGNNYQKCASSIGTIANTYVKIFGKLKQKGYNLGKIYLIGHGLGAQICGSIGRKVKSELNIRLYRITGLDPVDYKFHKASSHNFKNIHVSLPNGISLNKNDARFVDIIHTSAGVIGVNYSSGDMDFWPNGGNKIQPACISKCLEDVKSTNCSCCNHDMSWRYYVDSLNGRTHKFMSQLCPEDVKEYSNVTCSTKAIASMGYNAIAYKSLGNYFVATDNTQPYYNYDMDYYYNYKSSRDETGFDRIVQQQSNNV